MLIFYGCINKFSLLSGTLASHDLLLDLNVLTLSLNSKVFLKIPTSMSEGQVNKRKTESLELVG